jgi:hypothetical protein
VEKIIDGVVTFAYFALVTWGGTYTLNKIYVWTRNAALEKAATDLGSLEHATRVMTGADLGHVRMARPVSGQKHK